MPTCGSLRPLWDFYIAGRRCGWPRAAPSPPGHRFFLLPRHFFPRWTACFTGCRCRWAARRAARSALGQLLRSLIAALAWLNYFGVKLGGDVQVGDDGQSVLMRIVVAARLGSRTRPRRFACR